MVPVELSVCIIRSALRPGGLPTTTVGYKGPSLIPSSVIDFGTSSGGLSFSTRVFH